MKSDILSAIGKKLRNVRKEKGLSLAEVARKSGITAGLLSKIENFRTMPSLPVLYKISEALEEPLSELVKPVDNEPESSYTIIRKGEGEIELRYDSKGLTYEKLMSQIIHNHPVKVVTVTVQPGVFRKPLANDSYELVYMLEGEIIYGLLDEEVHLKQGDTLYFNGQIPHSLKNPGDQSAILFKTYFMNSGD
ncbi:MULTISPECIES: helix-turn-helix domain-containing protein [Roseivirga]|jgi:transcriptional regulator with XRE-family HTH domain|uniref:HTH cro/C1-type domain-containing protein n=1 Tax=Roseivirga thermotolerans TaxID=1758176 RepID=A0ABQ3I4G0_9BACT|nr:MULTISPECIES: helix-turn-helix domain-containing protein [Roseivirga]MEC7754086.1 helix-turn-helix domain-containing protein [Bacteroidota bacterium]GHE60821.1 hypothetical protein GCM10011340_14660 [Roseivirga thermotolerans]|tara:strand:+ start:8680 stop:9255 length:576 start_codon:yes stop_codon:yes gene_type:complete